jgi:diguanylate cyclase (GGDEF)-like protein
MSGLIAAGMAHASEYEDQSEQAKSLFFRATYDSMTGLHNRASFYDHLRRTISWCSRYKEGFSVAMLDMDGLKGLNDVYGHQAGDAALKTIGSRLRVSCRESDIAARLGGDEFGLILAKIGNREAAELAGCQILEKINGTFEFEGITHTLQTSLGCSVFPHDGSEPDDLLKTADAAMYSAKTMKRVACEGSMTLRAEKEWS